ncbi:MAG TPA: hypothetical protein VLF94_01470 [Chlamydiales bacterium]|nr:hypothetical protein [Chlamydiales bacterium]
MKLSKTFALLALIVPTLLLAQEDAEHVVVGSSPMSEEAAEQIAAEKAKMAEEAESVATSGFVFDRYPPVYFSNSHHWLVAIQVLDQDKYALELEDGARWKINAYDGSKALNWRANDPLTITQNTRWFSNYSYRIINKSTGSSVEANLHEGPIENGSYTRYIMAIDYDRREMTLTDNTHWEVSILDALVFKNWPLSHAIIIGTNSGWDSSYEALLINVNKNNCVRAKQF